MDGTALKREQKSKGKDIREVAKKLLCKEKRKRRAKTGTRRNQTEAVDFHEKWEGMAETRMQIIRTVRQGFHYCFDN